MALIGISGKIGSGKDTVGKIIQYLSYLNHSELSWEEYLNTKPGGYTGEWQIQKFGGALKDIVCTLTGCTREQLEDQDFKKKVIGPDWVQYYVWTDGHKKLVNSSYYHSTNKTKEINELTYRELLQILGTEAGRNIIHPNIWVNALFSKYKQKGGRWDYKRVDNVWVKGVTEKVAKSFGKGNFRQLPLVYPNWIITDMRFPNELKAVKDRGGITIRINRNKWVENDNPVIEQVLNTTKDFSKEHPSETALDNAEFDYVIDNNGSIEDLIEKVKLIKNDIFLQ